MNKKKNFMLKGILCGIVIVIMPASGAENTFLQLSFAPLSLLASFGVAFYAWKVISAR